MATDRPSLVLLYGSRTMLVLAALGFCGGLPNVLVTGIVPVWVSEAGWSVQLIGLVALLQLPYAFKFLWAPLVDRVRIPLLWRMGMRRSWLLTAQCGVCAFAIAAAFVGPKDSGNLAFMLLLAAMVVCSSTQDIVADAYRVQVLRRDELGAGAGVFVSGYRMAFVVVGALVLQQAAVLGWTAAVVGASLLAALGLAATLAAREPPQPATPEPGLSAAILDPATDLIGRWGARLLALGLFVLLFRLPDQLGNMMTAPLLVKGLGYSLADIGWVRQGLGFALTIVGALTGGWMVARIGLMRCLWIFGALQAASNAGFWLLAWIYGASVAAPAQSSAPLMALVPVIAVESLAGGLVSAGFVAYLMSVCNVKFVATQFALLTGLMAAGGALGGSLSGVLAQRLDYPAFFLATIAIGIPGMALIALVRPESASIAAPCPPR